MNLTPRESEILAAIIAGKMNKQIAREQGRALGTIRTQITTLLRKVGVRSRVELAVWGVMTQSLSCRSLEGGASCHMDAVKMNRGLL